MCRTKKGFTLIELLVVIAIIAILAAILFPVFARAKESAREAMCMTHIKQIAYAFTMYRDDWNDCNPDQSSVTFPDVVPLTSMKYSGDSYSNAMGGDWRIWYSQRYRWKSRNGSLYPAGLGRALRPYVKSIKVFKCPSEPNDNQKARDNAGYVVPYEEESSYIYKHALCYYSSRMMRPLRVSEVEYPKRCSMLYEEGWHQFQRGYLWDLGYWSNKSNRPSALVVDCVFVDAHCGKFRIPLVTMLSPYDGNWYYYIESSPNANSYGHYWNVTTNTQLPNGNPIGYTGARDVFEK